MMQFLLHVLSGVIGLFITCGIWVVAVWLHDMVTGHRDEDEEREEDEECEEEGRREVSETTEKSAPVGNAAKMREALERVRDWLGRQNTQRLDAVATSEWMCPVHVYQNVAKGLIEDNKYHISEIETALSAPLRNCDVGNADDQLARFRDYCIAQHPEPVPAAFYCCDCPNAPIGCIRCLLAWMQMPYEEGASK